MKVASLLALAMSSAVAPVLAQTALPAAGRQYALLIERQPLVASLRDLSEQTGLQLVGLLGTNGNQANVIVGPLQGQYTAEAALTALLAQSDLVFKRVNERTIAIIGRPVERKKSEAAQTHSFMRLNSDDERGFGMKRVRLAGAEAVAAASRESSLADPSEEVIVTGTHIRGFDNPTAPVIVLDRRYIDASGASTAAALIQTLPQNFALSNQSGVLVSGVSGGREQGAAINLRGVGEGTTLVLINGKRMASGFLAAAADISALPLSAIERVEILTDGASAIYGSDAIGGVVNFILRRDFDGAETRLRSGWAEGGLNEYRLSQALGESWESGSAMISGEYYSRDMLMASERSFVPDTSIIGSLLPEDQNRSLMFAGRQDVSDRVSLDAHALYTDRNSRNRGGRMTYNESYSIDNPQFVASLGAAWRMFSDWQLDLSGGYADNKQDQVQRGDLNDLYGTGSYSFDARFKLYSGQIKADGSLLTLPGGPLRLAVGADWRSEEARFVSKYELVTYSQRVRVDQIVRSSFAELHVPVFGANNAVAGARRLDLSVAARWDDYSTFGSSVDPRYGLSWEPVSGVRFRASHGSSYRAPNLYDYNVGNNLAMAFTDIDPGTSAGSSYQLQISGVDAASLAAQEATSSSFGIEFAPASHPELRMAFNYYDIDYRDRISSLPYASVMLANEDTYSSLIIRDPTTTQVNDYIAAGLLGQGFYAYNPDFSPNLNFDPESIDVIIDTRRRNLSRVKTSGMDLSVSYDAPVSLGNLHLGVDTTYILELDQQVSSGSAAYETRDTYGNPPSWRLRGAFGLQHEGLSTNVFVNYTDSYVDNRGITPAAIDSYTTFDVRVAYDFSERFKGTFLNGAVLAASVQNAFDQSPPATAIISPDSDMGFDPTNASPLGRLFALELIKSW